MIRNNKVKNNTTDNKKDKRHNKSFDRKKEAVKKNINEDLNNFKKNKTNKNKTINSKNNKKDIISEKSSSYLTVSLNTEKQSSKNVNYINKPFDINCLSIKNDKMIKDELMQLSDNNVKIKNVQKQKYNISFKSLDLCAEITIEKYDNSLNLLKVRKIMGKSTDYWNQLNIILRKLSV